MLISTMIIFLPNRVENEKRFSLGIFKDVRYFQYLLKQTFWELVIGLWNKQCSGISAAHIQKYED